MKTSILFVTAFILTLSAYAQEPDTSWKNGGFINLNFNQVSLNQWAQGGENSISLASAMWLFANYAKDRTTWDNSLDLAYSMIKTGSQALRKNDDKIDFTSKYGRKISDTGKWYYSALLNFKSQMFNGYLYPNDSTVVSKLFAPAYLTIALGVNYKPVDYFEVFISPLTGKLTFVNDQTLADAGAYGVKAAATDATTGIPQQGTGENIRKEFGAYLNLKFKKEVLPNMVLLTKLELFDNYSDDDANNRANVDVNWEVGLAMMVNKLVNVTITTQLLYDDDIIQRTQFKEVFGVGLGYKFN